MQAYNKTMKLRAMIVDDAPFIHEVLENYLHKYEVEIVASAFDGKEAISIANQVRPNFILMDMALPELNGLDATIKIHQLHPEIRIIAMSSMAEESMICKAIEAGCYDFLDKAFASGHLAEIIEKLKEDILHIRGEVVNG